MSRTQRRATLYVAAVIAAIAAVTGFAQTRQQPSQEILFNEQILEDSPFAAFKEDVVDTECIVERIGKFPSYGGTIVGRGADVTPAEASAAYDCAKPDLRAGYGSSNLPAAVEYLDWPVFSTGPYRSRAHTQRFVSNYANDIAAPFYGRFEAVERMPVGSILAKDSFIVSDSGRVAFGSLGVMEKMPAGFSSDTGDWRFTMILPDGRLFGVTKEENEAAVQFCADCHRDAGAGQDFMFFMPQRNRVTAR